MNLIANYLWRLLPANPILLRVVSTGGKRWRDLIVRCAYLGLLVVLVLFALANAGDLSGTSLDNLSRTSVSIFRNLSYLQLALVALLAPIFTAGAITQEKDSQTYDILLATPLTNAQIVLGSLLSRLFFVVALLVSGIPIFSITQIFGGVAIGDIVLSFLIAAVTALVTGALAIAIATFKVGTRRTIFSFYMLIIIYLVGLFQLDRVAYFHVPLAGGGVAATSWFTGLNPFLALRVVLDPTNYVPPDVSQLPAGLQWWPMRWYLAAPASFYVSLMFFVSAVLVLPSIFLLRRMAQSSQTFQMWLGKKLTFGKLERRKKPRSVWSNPIAWREAKTKGSASRAGLLRYAFIILGTGAACTAVVLFSVEKDAPAKFIAPGGYDPAANTLFVQGEQIYSLSPDLAVTVNGDPADASVLAQRMAVLKTSSNLYGDKKLLTTIDLAPVARLLDADATRKLLLGLVFLEFATILLIVTNASANTVTREKEDGSLDLLLTTPITSRYYIWGKLRGLVSFALPFIAVPVASVAIFVVYDLARALFGRGGDPIVLPESLLVMPGMLVIVVAIAAIVGMQMSLRCRTTVRAVMSSLGIVLGLCAVLGWVGYKILENSDNPVALAVGSFSPFTVLMVLLDPRTYGGGMFAPGSTDQPAARFTVIAFALAATGAYAAIVWAMYKSMVKNFDMTIRRQSR